ncbi:MAG: 3-methyl-2-oxobutanoate hydroxymethyltransferase [Bdellovibrionales bacterium]|nr:3-methyl-2-oxobutanoate hydroxymethyltransferase [Bdellovibrionales bacterium]
MSTAYDSKSITVPAVRAQKGERALSMLTAYDAPFATLLDQSGVDMLLVGDSLGTVVHGEPNTLGVTMDEMVRATRSVSRAAKRALVIADMPFLSYQVSIEDAVRNAGRFLKEAGAQAVKLEGGVGFAPVIRALVAAGIPVCAHIGLMPQSLHTVGAYRMHGKTPSEREVLLADARAVEEAGAFCLVLECVEATLAAEITRSVRIPTIGIGSGAGCDGQVLVIHDLLGLTPGRVPKFVRPLADLGAAVRTAVGGYLARTENEYREAAGKPGLTTEFVSSPIDAKPKLPAEGRGI